MRIVRATRDPVALSRELSEREPGRSRRRGEDAAERRERLALLASAPVTLGASPRASIYLARAARARALLDGRRFATPHDIKRVAPDVLRHRIVVSYEAEADDVRAEDVVRAILASVDAP